MEEFLLNPSNYLILTIKQLKIQVPNIPLYSQVKIIDIILITKKG